MRRRLEAVAGDKVDASQIEALTLGYLRDRQAHDEVEARDTLEVEDPPPLAASGPKKPGPKKRPPPCPEALREALLGRPSVRWGPENGASKLDDYALIFAFCHVAWHKKRGLSPRDLDLQEEFCVRRGLNYPALTSQRSSFQQRGLPDALRPLLGRNRSRIRRDIVAVLLHCSARQKTGVTLSVLEWAMLLFCGKSAVAEHLTWLEERGFIYTISRYVPATHVRVPVEHRANFYTLGPKLIELRDLWERPHYIGASKRRGALSLQTARRRHKFRILRGRHLPRPYLSPEAWLVQKAESDAAQLVDEEIRRRRSAALGAEEDAAAREAAAQLAAGQSGLEVMRAMLERQAAVQAEKATLRTTLPRELLVEHLAASEIAGECGGRDLEEDVAIASDLAALAELEAEIFELDDELAGDDADDDADDDALAADDVLAGDDASDDDALAADDVLAGDASDDALGDDDRDDDALAADAVLAGDASDDALAGDDASDDVLAGDDASDDVLAGDEEITSGKNSFSRDLVADSLSAHCNYELCKPFRPPQGTREQTRKAAAAATPLPIGRPRTPASQVAAVPAVPETPGALAAPAPDPGSPRSVAPPTHLERPLLIMGCAPSAPFAPNEHDRPAEARSEETGHMQPVSKDRSHASGFEEHGRMNLRELVERVDRGETGGRPRGSPRRAAEAELLRTLARASPELRARLRRDPADDDPAED